MSGNFIGVYNPTTNTITGKFLGLTGDSSVSHPGNINIFAADPSRASFTTIALTGLTNSSTASFTTSLTNEDGSGGVPSNANVTASVHVIGTGTPGVIANTGTTVMKGFYSITEFNRTTGSFINPPTASESSNNLIATLTPNMSLHLTVNDNSSNTIFDANTTDTKTIAFQDGNQETISLFQLSNPPANDQLVVSTRRAIIGGQPGTGNTLVNPQFAEYVQELDALYGYSNNGAPIGAYVSGYVGELTSLDHMPNNLTATYNGLVQATFVPQTGNAFNANGTAMLFADFSTNTISSSSKLTINGSLNSNGTLGTGQTVLTGGGPISGNTFAITLSGSGFSGNAGGAFYGPSAQELAGGFNTSNTQNGSKLQGVFVAKH